MWNGYESRANMLQPQGTIIAMQS